MDGITILHPIGYHKISFGSTFFVSRPIFYLKNSLMVVPKRTNQILNDISPPKFPMEEVDISTNDEIIVETLHPQIMIMSSS